MQSGLPYIPHDELSGPAPDADLAADISEIGALLSASSEFLLTDLRNDLEIGSDEYRDTDEHNSLSDAALNAAATAIERRTNLLGNAYPFSLDARGFVLRYKNEDEKVQNAYVLCLILSHLKAVSPVLDQADLEPDPDAQRKMRDWFQKLCAPALAAEVRGHAWAFGHPRADRTGFLEKLRIIWNVVRDGAVVDEAPNGASDRVKDDAIDVIAARPNADGAPGFPIAVAQVATGKKWDGKSIRNAAENVFFKFWFKEHPASQITSYHFIPFSVPYEDMRFKTLLLGHLVHRMRFVSMLAQAVQLIARKEIQAEGDEAFTSVGTWIKSYRGSEMPGTA